MISCITSPVGVTLSLGMGIASSRYFLISSMALRTSMPSSASHCRSTLNKTSQNTKHTGLIPQFPIHITWNNSRGLEAGAHNLNFKLSVITYVSHYLSALQIHGPEPTAGESLPPLTHNSSSAVKLSRSSLPFTGDHIEIAHSSTGDHYDSVVPYSEHLSPL